MNFVSKNFEQSNSERVRCRNSKCRSKLSIPTDNDHKAFCTPFCHEQFHFWRCLVCENPIQRGRRRVQPRHCHARDCRLAFKRFPETYLYPKTHESIPCGQSAQQGSRSARFTGVKSAQNGPRIIAGPPLSDFSLWAATLDPPKPAPSGKSWGQPGVIAEAWTARALAAREAVDEQYVIDDEARLQSEPVDASGNYAPHPATESGVAT